MSNPPVVQQQAPWANQYAKPGSLPVLGAFVQMLRKFAENAGAVPNGVDINRLSAACITAARRAPKLLDCTFLSWGKAVTDAYAWGLDPTKREVWFIPYGSEVQCIVGYQGLLTLCRRHPNFIDVEADTVPGTDWEQGAIQIELSPWSLKRALVLREDDSAGWAFAYAQVKFRSGGEVLTKGHILQWFEIVKRAEQSKGCIWDAEHKKFVGKKNDRGEEKSSPWVLWTREMARKSVLAAFLRSGQVPMSADALSALDREDELQTKLAEMETGKLSNTAAAQKLLAEEAPAVDYAAEAERLNQREPVPVGGVPSVAQVRELMADSNDGRIMDAYAAANVPDGVPIEEMKTSEREAFFKALGGGR